MLGALQPRTATLPHRRNRRPLGGRTLKNRLITAALALLLVTLSACGAKADRAVAELARLRELHSTASRIVTVARVSADYGERVFEFRIRYSGTYDAGELEILAPESLAGVTARVSGNAATLSYDGAELDTGSLGDGLSPAGIVPRLIVEWQSGFPDSLMLARNNSNLDVGKSPGFRREELIMQSMLTSASERGTDARQTTRFDAETHIPIRSEVLQDGRVVLTVRYESFALE